MKIIGYIAAVIMLLFLSAVWNGYALTVLWGWFITPVFSLPKLDLLAAAGVALVVGFLTHQKEQYDKGKSYSEILLDAYGAAILKPAFYILIGWVITLFI